MGPSDLGFEKTKYFSRNRVGKVIQGQGQWLVLPKLGNFGSCSVAESPISPKPSSWL